MPFLSHDRGGAAGGREGRVDGRVGLGGRANCEGKIWATTMPTRARTRAVDFIAVEIVAIR